MRKDTLETRRQMLDAAEALFAEHGVDQVTLLEIGRAAGQKNRNALQYHFGDKAGVINAVLDKHTDLIAKERNLMMDDLEQTDSITLRDMIRVFVLPIAHHIAGHKNNRAFLLINCQILMSPSYTEINLERYDGVPGIKRMRTQFARVLPDYNADELHARFMLCMSLLFHGLASYYADKSPPAEALYVAILCDSIEAVLSQ